VWKVGDGAGRGSGGGGGEERLRKGQVTRKRWWKRRKKDGVGEQANAGAKRKMRCMRCVVIRHERSTRKTQMPCMSLKRMM
jgi:hypothetical protein